MSFDIPIAFDDSFIETLVTLPAEKRVSFAFNYFKESRYDKLLSEVNPKSMKSTLKAVKFKNFGNASYKLKKIVEALKHYTKSIAVAPDGSLDLAIAYSNRSAALFELKRYDACIVDINRASLIENCPKAVRQRLHDRKQKICRSKMTECNAAQFGLQVRYSYKNPLFLLFSLLFQYVDG